MEKLTRSYPSIVAVLKESSLLVVSSDGKNVKHCNPLPFIGVKDPKVTTLNDEHDWRNSLRVKCLTQMGKHGQRRQAWRGSDPETNTNAQASDQTGDAENNTSSELHEDVPDEEDGEHLSDEKNGHRCRNRGRARRQKTHKANRLGHGTTSSSHAVFEPIEATPGPQNARWNQEIHNGTRTTTRF